MQDKHIRSLAKIALMGAVLAGYLLALVLEASPELHRQLHHDSGDAQHECLVTCLDHSGCEATVIADCALTAFAEFSDELIKPEAAVASSFFLTCSILEHGPPILSLS